MRSIQLPLLIITIVLSDTIAAQQVDWLQSWPVSYSLNPAMPDQALASAGDELIGMRLVNATHVYGQKVYGEVSMDRLDPLTGEVLLSCLLGDSITIDAIEVDPAGIGYFAGRFQGDQLLLCDGSVLPGSPLSPFDEHAFLIAWDMNDDEILWSRDITMDHGFGFTITSLTLDPDGDLWYSIEDFFTGKVIEVDQQGNDAEVRVIDGCKRIGAISFDPWGGLYVSGAADNNGTFSFAGTSPTVPAEFDYGMFVLRYRPDGSAGFAEFASDITFQAPEVIATNDGHAYLACDLFDTTSWGGISFNGPDWVNSLFITKLDSTGQFIWGIESDPAGGTLTGDLAMAKGDGIAIDASNNVYLLGNLRGSVDWGNSVVSDGLTIGAHSLTVVAFSPDGIAQWAATSFPGSFLTAHGISVADHGVHFSSHVTSELVFGSETTNAGGEQAAVVGLLAALPTEIKDEVHQIGIIAWPNPATDQLVIQNNESSMDAVMFNGTGERIKSFTLRSGNNTMDVSMLPPGIYLLRSGSREAFRVVKQ